MVEIAQILCRIGLYGSLTLLIGGMLFLPLVWPDGYRSNRMRSLLKWSWVAALIMSLLILLLQGPVVTDQPMSAIADMNLLRVVLTTWFGGVAVARIALLAILGVFLLVSIKKRPDGILACTTIALSSAGLAATMSMSGHAVDRGTVVLAVDMIHFVAASAWIGGLVVLFSVVLPTQRSHELATVVPAFSTIAFTSVVLLMATGSYHAFIQVGSVESLTGTEYGRFICLKMVAFTTLIGLGAASRQWTKRRYSAASSAHASTDRVFRKKLRRNVGVEAGIAFLVLVLTALLVTSEPPTEAIGNPTDAGFVDI